MATLTAQEAADQAGVSARRIRALIAAGKLPAKKVGRTGGGEWAIRPQDLRLIEKGPNGRRGPKK